MKMLGKLREWFAAPSAGDAQNGSFRPTPNINPGARISLSAPPICRQPANHLTPASSREIRETAVHLATSGYLGTAVEHIERQLRRDPESFEMLMELAHIQAIHCGNIGIAEKIVTRIENNFAFPEEQRQQAVDQLRVWRDKANRQVRLRVNG